MVLRNDYFGEVERTSIESSIEKTQDSQGVTQVHECSATVGSMERSLSCSEFNELSEIDRLKGVCSMSS